MVELNHDHHGTMALGVEWAPISVPFERRLQTLAVFFHFMFVLLFCSIFVPWFGLYLVLYTHLRWLVIIYMIWMFIDFETPTKGSRPWKWFKGSMIWKYFRDYFPISLHKTAELDPKNKYHPHGLAGIGFFVNFATDATGFSTKFPGMNVRTMTLRANFIFPLVREYIMALGLCSVSKESISYCFNNPEKCNAVVIVVGGALEALEAHPGRHDISLSPRKGFIKIAMKHGAHLVPVYSFGENDLYWTAENPKGSFYRKVQLLVKKITRISPVIFHGRGMFNYTMGLLPYRRPVNTVVGKPIPVTQNSNPSREEVAELHSKYVKGLQELFDSQKANFGPADAQLNIL